MLCASSSNDRSNINNNRLQVASGELFSASQVADQGSEACHVRPQINSPTAVFQAYGSKYSLDVAHPGDIFLRTHHLFLAVCWVFRFLCFPWIWCKLISFLIKMIISNFVNLILFFIFINNIAVDFVYFSLR